MISVVLPNYNSAKYLAATIRSVQSQSVTEWELIVVDDGSEDNSLVVAEEFQRQDSRISVRTQANAGASAARNHGLRAANPAYPYALCLDSDDLLAPDAMQTLLSELESRPDAPAACGFVSEIDGDGRPIAYHRFEPQEQRRGISGLRLVRRAQEAPVTFGDLCFHNHIITPGQVLIRKSALAVTGPFDLSLVYVEDYDLWWRLAMQVGPIVLTPTTVLLYRIHGASISRNKAAVKRGQADWRERLLTYPRMTPRQRKTARIGYFYHCLIAWEFAAYKLRRREYKQALGLLYKSGQDALGFARDLVKSAHKSEPQECA